MEKAFTKKLMIQKFSDIKVLPIYPDTSLDIKFLFRKKSNDIKEYINIIKRDPCFVASILKKIQVKDEYLTEQTLDNTIQRIGLFQLKAMISEIPVLKDVVINEKISWEHCYSTFILMTNLLSENEIPVGPDLPLAMLFHDIGNVVLKEYTPRMYKMAVEHSDVQKVADHVAQNKLIHINHAEIGAIVLSKWGFAESIYKPIMYHHIECEERKDVPEDFVLETALVQFVDYVDNVCRGRVAQKPTDFLLETAGISEIDYTYWIRNQQKVIIDVREGKRAPEEEVAQKVTDTATVVMSRSDIPKPNLQKNQALDNMKKNLFK